MMNGMASQNQSGKIMTLQQQFEARASELGYSVRKDASGEYIYKPTGKLWGWYQAGAHSVLEYGDPHFLMGEFNHPYEG